MRKETALVASVLAAFASAGCGNSPEQAVTEKAAFVQEYKVPPMDAATFVSENGEKLTITRKDKETFEAFSDKNKESKVSFRIGADGKAQVESGAADILKGVNFAGLNQGGNLALLTMAGGEPLTESSTPFHRYSYDNGLGYWMTGVAVGHIMSSDSSRHSYPVGGYAGGGSAVSSGKSGGVSGHSVANGTRGGFGSVGGRSAVS